MTKQKKIAVTFRLDKEVKVLLEEIQKAREDYVGRQLNYGDVKISQSQVITEALNFYKRLLITEDHVFNDTDDYYFELDEHGRKRV